ncbi:MAG: helix-turn-helix transcriptional regulator, partial [Gammaproteobacteria bacterium]
MLDLVVKPVPADPVTGSAGGPSVVVYLNHSSRPGIELDPVVLGSMYGLTPSESRIGSLLAKGTCLTEIADRLGVSVNTV